MNHSSMPGDEKRPWSEHITRPLDLVTRLCWYASGLSLFLVLAAYIFEVVMRYFLGTPTSWSNDVIQLFFAAMILLALPEVTRIKGHIVISFFLEKMRPTSRLRIGRVIAFTGSVMCLFTAWICWQETMRQYTQGIETLWNHPIPKWWISIFIPFGFILSGFQMLKNVFMPKES